VTEADSFEVGASQPTTERPGRAMGVDLGARRIGIAVSDSSGTMASPRTTVVRSGDAERDRRALVALAVEEEAVIVVVGHPLALDGSRTAAARAAEAELELLAPMLDAVGIDAVLFDERLTTVSAQRALSEGGTRAHKQRAVVDRAAAAVLLDAWLDARRGRNDRA